MKKLLILLVIFLSISDICNAQAGRWRKLIDAATFEIYANPHNYNTLFAGGEGRVVYRSYDRGETWDTLVIGYRGGSAVLNNVLVHPHDTNVVIIGGLLFGDVRRSTNHGDDWEIVLQENFSVSLNGKALMMDEINPDNLYIGEYGTGRIYKSTDRGATWDSISRVKQFIKYYDDEGNVKDTLYPVRIGSLGIRPDSSNIILCNTTDGEVHMSTDYGVTWDFKDRLTMPGLDRTDCEITRLTFSDLDPLTGYAVITYLFSGNVPNGGLHKTTDGGYNWDLIALPDTSMWAVAVRSYNNSEEVFVGGYTEDFYDPSSAYVQGAGVIRRSQDGGKTWIPVDRNIDWKIEYPLLNNSLKDIHFPDPDHGYAVGEGGLIFKNEDGNREWNYISQTLSDDFNTVFFSSENIGFVAGENGVLYKSTNGGFIWSKKNSATSFTLNDIVFIDQFTGIAVGNNGTITRTLDEGETWLKSEVPDIQDSLKTVFFINNTTGYAGGEGGTILKTEDAGLSWIEVTNNLAETVNSLFFIDETNAFLCGNDGLLARTENSGSSWEFLDAPEIKNYNGIFFTDKNTGYAVGDEGRIIYTTDGGDTWDIMFSDTFRDINSIFFSTPEVGYATCDLRTILQTQTAGYDWRTQETDPPAESNFNAVFNNFEANTFIVGDEGKIFYKGFESTSWTMQNSGTEDNLYAVFITDTTNGYVCGDNGVILRTANLGNEWAELSSGVNTKLNAIHFLEYNHGFACGDAGVLLKTTDAGSSWQTLNSGTNENLNTIFHSDTNTVYAAGNNGTFLKSTDGGNTWTKLDLGITENINAIYFINNRVGYAACDGGMILKTENHAEEWHQQTTGTNEDIKSIDFGNFADGVAAGNNGTILKTTNSGINWYDRRIPDSHDDFLGINYIVEYVATEGYAVGKNGKILYYEYNGSGWKSPLIGYGPRANVWSMRYWGEPGNESIYMATEAGLFVMDNPSPVHDEERDTFEEFTVAVSPVQSLIVRYTRLKPDSEKPLEFRIANLRGDIVFSKKVVNYSKRIIENIDIPDLPTGAYICQMIEGSENSTYKIVIK